MLHALTTRQSLLLYTLLRSENYRSVNSLSAEIGVARKSIFADLPRIDEMLKRHGLTLSALPTKGLLIRAEDEKAKKSIDMLKADIEKIQGSVPSDSAGKLRYLFKVLCDNDDDILLGSVAKRLKLTDDEIQALLVELANTLKAYHLKIQVKSVDSILPINEENQLVRITGSEKDIRRAITAMLPPNCVHKAGVVSYVSNEVYDTINVLKESHFGGYMSWMLPDSIDELCKYLMIAITRISLGFLLPVEANSGVNSGTSRNGKNGKNLDFAENKSKKKIITDRSKARKAASDIVVSMIDSSFDVLLNQAEVTQISDMIAHARRVGSFSSNLWAPAAFVDRMIEAFDNNLAPRLKKNDMLVSCLTQHISALMSRATLQKWEEDPLGGEIAREHPDVYEKTLHAVAVLERELQTKIPESEVSFIAMHFGAAMLNLKSRAVMLVKPCIAVVCLAGIGTSYIIMSQLNIKYGDSVDLYVVDALEHIDDCNPDFIVTSVDIDYKNRPIVKVNPILIDNDYVRIDAQIKAIDFASPTKKVVQLEPFAISGRSAHLQTQATEVNLRTTRASFLKNMATVDHATSTAHSIVSSLAVHHVDAGVNFHELLLYIGKTYAAANATDAGKSIAEGLLQREIQGTQILEQFGIALLHCKHKDITQPIIGIIKPTNSKIFLDPYFRGIGTVIAMLFSDAILPDEADIFGYISSSFVEDKQFLSDITNADDVDTKKALDLKIAQYISEKVVTLIS
ncbi:MAG: PRD domain-containing protein [Clostridiales Family XIII bacterium]|jgi:mannitol operon transcriptional antiterminator|nr:PRD domain-containing protein [Clostridiales Family XIII bacterium]